MLNSIETIRQIHSRPSPSVETSIPQILLSCSDAFALLIFPSISRLRSHYHPWIIMGPVPKLLRLSLSGDAQYSVNLRRFAKVETPAYKAEGNDPEWTHYGLLL
jgi:hypothetical protein